MNESKNNSTIGRLKRFDEEAPTHSRYICDWIGLKPLTLSFQLIVFLTYYLDFIYFRIKSTILKYYEKEYETLDLAGRVSFLDFS